MLRRRLLEALFKFKSNKNALSYDYGIQLPPETIKEYGRYVGSNQSVVNINNETYYALYGKSPAPTKDIGNSNLTNTGTPTSPQTSAYVNIATYNFKTTSNNQNVTFTFKASCENPNDFLGATQLDNSDISNLAVKVTGTESKTYIYNVATAGDHFIKVYYYQHNDNTLSNDNAGYFRMTPYDIVNYSYRYKAPDTQTCTLTSYYGWNLASKPAWVKLGKLNNQNQFVEITTDNSGNNDIVIEVQSNPGNNRSGNIVLREKYSGQEVTISVSQGANPHPNDIIVSYGKLTVPQNYTGSNQLSVELVGNTSYTISNVSSGLTVSPMNGSNDKISISNAQGNNANGSFRITGNAGTVKDIYISKEYLSCYCDCNIFDSCACHINTSFTKKDDTSCPTNNCRANSQISCPKHVENYMNQGNCNGHTACSCDCNAVNTCTCNTNIVCDCNNGDNGESTQPCTHGGVSTQPCTHGGSSTQPCTHGGVSTKPCTHGGSSTQPCTHGGSSTQPCTHGGSACSCYGNVGTTECSCHGNVGSTACSCHGNVGSTECSCYGNVGSTECSCYGNTGVYNCSCNNCNNDTTCYDSWTSGCKGVCNCEGQETSCNRLFGCSCDLGYWAWVSGCSPKHIKDETPCSGNEHTNCNGHKSSCGSEHTICGHSTCGDCSSNNTSGSWSSCSFTCTCESNVETESCTHGGSSTKPCTHGGSSTQPCTHGGVSTKPCTHGGSSTKPCTHGGSSTQPCTHGGVSTKPCTHGGVSTKSCTHGGVTCSCYGNVGSTPCSCYGNVGSTPCSCYGNVGSTECSCHGNVGSTPCSCYGNVGSTECSCYGNVGSTECSCYGFTPVKSCHSHDNLCSRNQCNTVNPTSCTCNVKTYYPHCDCDQFCKCDGYYVPCESKASRTTTSPCTSYTPNP